MKKTFLLIVVVLVAFSTSMYSQSKKDSKGAAVDKQIQDLKSEISNLRNDLDNQKREIDNLRKSNKKIFTKSVVITSYYDGSGNRIAPGGSSDAEVKIDFPDNYFTQKPEIIIAVRGWSYCGRLTADNSQRWEGITLQQNWPLGPNWVKAVDVTRNYAKVRAFLYEKEGMNDNVFLVDVVAIGE